MSATITITPTQAQILQSAADDGELSRADRRALPGMERRGWVQRRDTRRRRKIVTRWYRTPDGEHALAVGEVVQPRPRPAWWETWQVERLTPTDYRVTPHERPTHQLVRPGRHMLWRAICPARGEDDPLALRDTLAEVVDVLSSHLCHERECLPRPADLDAVR